MEDMWGFRIWIAINILELISNEDKLYNVKHEFRVPLETEPVLSIQIQ